MAAEADRAISPKAALEHVLIAQRSFPSLKVLPRKLRELIPQLPITRSDFRIRVIVRIMGRATYILFSGSPFIFHRAPPLSMMLDLMFNETG